MSKIKVGIIEDDAIIRNNLVRFLEMTEEIEVVFAEKSVESYKEQEEQEIKYLDLLLLDIGLPGMSGLDAISLFLKDRPTLNIAILTTYEEEDVILRAMAEGAVAYISKKSGLAEIIDILKIVHAGGSYMSPNIARDVFNYMVKSKTTQPEAKLSERQIEVLDSLVSGKSYVKIGQELFISPETVRTHIKNIYQKLKVKNKAEAIGKYFETNLHKRKKKLF